MKKRNIRILAILLIIAFFFSFIQTRPYSVRHSTVYTNDNTLEIELYIVTNRRLSNTGGAGLGLSISEEIIYLHGGTITASSQNETIDFVITLPISA